MLRTQRLLCGHPDIIRHPWVPWGPRDATGIPEDKGHHCSRDTSQRGFLWLVPWGTSGWGACTVVPPGWVSHHHGQTAGYREEEQLQRLKQVSSHQRDAQARGQLLPWTKSHRQSLLSQEGQRLCTGAGGTSLGAAIFTRTSGVIVRGKCVDWQPANSCLVSTDLYLWCSCQKVVKILRALPGLLGKGRAPIPAQSAWNPPEALLLGSFSFWQGFASVYGGTHSGTRQKPQGNYMDFSVLWTIGPIWANHMTLEWKESLPRVPADFQSS